MSDEKPADRFRLDRSHFEVRDLDAPDDDGTYWLTKTPEERMLALAYLRRMAFGDAATERLQRVFSVARLGEK
ncbi:MAG: hypothetical protein SF069_10280 [Phycisphaerae bacterium]|nr:hypothetical protein [Phycisphaerae bacterium]